MKPGLIATIILATTSILAFSSSWNDSFIVDEIPHVGAGYSYVIKNDFRLNPEHPPLAKDLAGLSLLALNLKQSVFETRFWNTDINGQWEFGRNFIYGSGNNADLITRTAKAPMLIFFIFSGILIFQWTKKQANSKAGLFALFLFSFSPTVIAHSRFVTTDMAALFGVLFGTYFFLRYLENKSQKNIWFAGLAFGIAQLTKFSVFLLVPYFIILALAAFFIAPDKKIKNLFKIVFGTAAIFMIGFIFIVWPVYGIHAINYPPEKQRADTVYHLGSYGNRALADTVIWASDKPYMRSIAHYATGLLLVNQRAVGGNTAYFLGEIRNYAWKHYFPVVYFLKEPLAFWGLIIIAISTIFTQVKNINNWIRNHFTEFSMFLWLVIYWYLSIRSNLNIGVRHLLPTYGFVFILLASRLTNLGNKLKIEGRQKKFAVYVSLLAVLFGWYLFENLKTYPYYLTYFNQTVLVRPSWALGQQPNGGYLYVVDSNIDWGQDAKRLAGWAEKNKISKISLDYFGWADAGYYLGERYFWINSGRYKNASEFLADNPDGGYIAVSKSYYMSSRENAETSYALKTNSSPPQPTLRAEPEKNQ